MRCMVPAPLMCADRNWGSEERLEIDRVPESVACPGCSTRLSYRSSEIGSAKVCSGCGREVEVPVPFLAQAQFDRRDRERDQAKAAWMAKWGKHDHIVDPQPV